MQIELSDDARRAIAEAGFDPDYGARPLRRVIQNRIQDPLSEELLSERFVPGDTILVDYGDTIDEDGKTIQDFSFSVSAHREVEGEDDTETTRALEAMLQ
jgi:ATP-dependent Clp protease ATP-binding subunit ClpA